MKIQLSPNKAAIAFTCVGLVVVGLASGTVTLPPGTPDWAEAIAKAYAQWGVNLWAIIGGSVLMLFSNSQPGALAPADPPIVVAATKQAEAAEAAKVAK